MTTAITRVITWLRGEQVGVDSEGNKYYQERRKPTERRRKRWVIYKGVDEASRVPPEWHGWLHYTVENLPSLKASTANAWQKEHRPNLTGTVGAYRPPGHLFSDGERSSATGDYEPWSPNKR